MTERLALGWKRNSPSILPRQKVLIDRGVVMLSGGGEDTRKFFHDCFYSLNELGSRITR